MIYAHLHTIEYDANRTQVIANMEPYKQNKDGSKGEKLPQIASGDNVDIILESGRYEAEGKTAKKIGEQKKRFGVMLASLGVLLYGVRACWQGPQALMCCFFVSPTKRSS